MAGAHDLLISDVLHKAYVSVDEAGTEAAAASAAIVSIAAMPSSTTTLSIDRPFIFVIRDIQTGTILFIGRVMNPADWPIYSTKIGFFCSTQVSTSWLALSE